MKFGCRPATGALCALVVLGATWLVAVPTDAGARGDSDARDAARLVLATRSAPDRYDFEGDATVGWTSAEGRRRARVRVTAVGGALEIVAADGNTVVDEGRRTYLRDELGWSGIVVEPSAHDLPAPGRRWKLSTGGTTEVAGRQATVVVAARPGGAPAQRLAVDDATGLLLEREVLGPEGEVQRSVRFSDLEVGTAADASVSSPQVRSRAAEALASVPDGYRAPERMAGFDLVTRSRHPDGVLLFYSDGVFTASVFEQRGDLDWDALSEGGDDTRFAGARTRVYREASGEVAVWQRGGVVYTCVTDAPSDVFEQMVHALAADDRSVTESVVDFVLDPFGWR